MILYKCQPSRFKRCISSLPTTYSRTRCDGSRES